MVGGGGYIHIFFFFFKNWIFNKLFTVWKHKSLLLQPSGWLHRNREVYLIDLCPSPSLTTFSLNEASDPVSNPCRCQDNWSWYLGGNREYAYIQTEGHTDKFKVLVRLHEQIKVTHVHKMFICIGHSSAQELYSISKI